MCDAKGTLFFRPWDVVESCDEASASCAKLSANGEPSVLGEEDWETVEGVPSERTPRGECTNGVADCRAPLEDVSERRLRRKSESSDEASSPVSSVAGEDASSRARLAMRCVSHMLYPWKTRCSASSAVSGETVPSEATPSSTVMDCWPTASSALPMDNLRQLAFHHQDTYAALTDSPTAMRDIGLAAIQTSSIATTGQRFCYDYAAVHLAPGLCSASMEHVVQMLENHEAAAKHMKKHRPKNFRCEHCDVAFSNKGQLKGHIRIHTGERPFKCDAAGCGKSFTRNEELTRHKRIHTGLRPHVCLICGKRFGRKDHLKKHARTHANRDPYRVSAAAFNAFALGHPFPPYVYPM